MALSARAISRATARASAKNGGQYTHGAIWLAMACLRTGRREEAWLLFGRSCPGSLWNMGGALRPGCGRLFQPDGQARPGGLELVYGLGLVFRVVTRELLGLSMGREAVRRTPRAGGRGF